jgi:hypothetical protein
VKGIFGSSSVLILRRTIKNCMKNQYSRKYGAWKGIPLSDYDYVGMHFTLGAIKNHSDKTWP